MLKTFIKLKLITCLVIKDKLQAYSFDKSNFSTWVFPVLQLRFNYRIVLLHERCRPGMSKIDSFIMMDIFLRISEIFQSNCLQEKP